MSKQENFSSELKKIFEFVHKDLLVQYPTYKISLYYFLYAMLDTKEAFLPKVLNNIITDFAMSNVKSYVLSSISSSSLSIVNPKKVVSLDSDVEAVIKLSEIEAKNMNDEKINSIHMCLAILKSDHKIKSTLSNVGISYDLLKSNTHIIEEEKDNDEVVEPTPKQKPDVLLVTPNGMLVPAPRQTQKKGKYQNIEQYTTNLSILYQQSKMDYVIGREKELNKVITSLLKRTKNNIIITGKQGSGITSIVNLLVQNMYSGNAPLQLLNKEVLRININSLVNGSAYKGIFEQRITELVKEIKSVPNKYILFIDDINVAFSSDNNNEIKNFIGSMLQDDELKLIATCPLSAYKATIEIFPHIEKRFTKIVVEPPTIEETLIILKQNKHYYEKYHNIILDDDILENSIKLCDKYITNKKLPSSAIEVIDILGSRTHLSTNSVELKEMVSNINNLIKQQELTKKNDKHQESYECGVKINKIQQDIKNIQKNEIRNSIRITEDDVLNVISELSKIPVNNISTDELKNLKTLPDKIKQEIINQDSAVEKVSKAIQKRRVNIRNIKKPSVFLFVGSSGCGKTFLAELLAKHVFGNEKNIIKLNGSEYSEEYSTSKILGCFTPETLILMENGEYKPISSVQIGENVITHNGNIKRINEIFIYDNNENIDEYTFANTNIKLDCTKQHELLVIKPTYLSNGRINRDSIIYENACFIQSNEVNVGDFVLYPKTINRKNNKYIIDLWDYCSDLPRYKKDEKHVWAYKNKKINRFIEVNNDFARLCGYYVSEGGNTKSDKSVNFTFHADEQKYVEETINLMRKIFSENLHIRIIDRRKTDGGNSVRFFITSRAISLFFKNIMGKNVYFKQIPEVIINSNKNIKLNFLETAIYGDGTTTRPRKIIYKTVSRKLGTQFHTMMRELGYSSQLTIFKNRKRITNKDTYHIILTGKSIEKINKEFPNLKVIEIDYKWKNIERRQYQDDEYYYYKILKKNSVEYNGSVYDLSIEDDSTYIASGICVHNSPSGYIGFGQDNSLSKIKNNPYSIVLLDEFEKIHNNVINIFLPVFDKGELVESDGTILDFSNTIFILTSNLGSRKSDSYNALGFTKQDENSLNKEKHDIIEKEIKKKLSPEIRNRIDEIVYFNHLRDDDIRNIIKLQLKKLSDDIETSKYKHAIQWDDEVVEWLLKQLTDEDKKLGARPVNRIISSKIEDKITEHILENGFKNDMFVKIENDCIILKSR